MNTQQPDIEALALAFEEFNRTTQAMEEAYRRLESRVQELDQELAEKNRALALTTDYLNSTLESMSDGVIAIDNEGRITTYNRAAADVLGFDRDDVIGEAFDGLFDRPFSAEAGQAAGELKSHESKTVRIAERDSPLSDRSGNVIGTVKVFQDLREIEALRERVQQKDRLAAIGEMAATVAHEIRNPLGGIRGFASLLRRDLDDDDPNARLVEKVLAGAQSLDRVVGELLEYTRPVEIRIREVNAADLIETAIGFLQYDAEAIEITREIEPGLMLLVDADKFRQVLLNILLNAVQAFDGPGSINIGASGFGGSPHITIRDNGSGMDTSELKNAFTPFFTTKEKGTGLGLAAAAKIVEAHGGSIDAVSEPGDGAAFTIRLPETP